VLGALGVVLIAIPSGPSEGGDARLRSPPLALRAARLGAGVALEIGGPW
jgi:hypothetical protein